MDEVEWFDLDEMLEEIESLKNTQDVVCMHCGIFLNPVIRYKSFHCDKCNDLMWDEWERTLAEDE